MQKNNYHADTATGISKKKKTISHLPKKKLGFINGVIWSGSYDEFCLKKYQM